MPKRTTVILEDDIYEKLVKESIRRYGTTRALSRVLNEILRNSFKKQDDLIRLIYSKKVVKITPEKFEKFRKELSKRFIER